MSDGDVVLIPFPFTDLTGIKTRPALILAAFETTIIVSFITSKINYQEAYDILLSPDENNGLKKPSILRLNKIVTVDKELVIGIVGNISETVLINVHESLVSMFKPGIRRI